MKLHISNINIKSLELMGFSAHDIYVLACELDVITTMSSFLAFIEKNDVFCNCVTFDRKDIAALGFQFPDELTDDVFISNDGELSTMTGDNDRYFDVMWCFDILEFAWKKYVWQNNVWAEVLSSRKNERHKARNICSGLFVV